MLIASKGYSPHLVRHFITQTSYPTVTEALYNEFKGFVPKSKLKEYLWHGAIYVQKQRVLTDVSVPSNAYLRIHLLPRTFPEVDKIDWNKVIVFENEDFVLIDKPTGVPIHATVDNYRENVMYQLEKETKQKYIITHRLDHGTSGLCVLAKTNEFQLYFQTLLMKRNLEKFYKAFVWKPVPLGILEHRMEPSLFVPVKLTDSTSPLYSNWKLCLLNVLSVQPTQKPVCIEKSTASDDEVFNFDWRYDPIKQNGVGIGERRKRTILKDMYEVDIKLITGRTHQIRSQLEYIGSPIVNDLIYDGGTKKNTFDPNYSTGYFPFISSVSFGLISHSIQFPDFRNRTEKFSFSL